MAAHFAVDGVGGGGRGLVRGVDAQIQVHQLRQFLQATPLASETVLRHLLLHHMHKAAKSAADRDKTDFLLVQYFSLCVPSGLADADVDLEYVAQVLEPVLGGAIGRRSPRG